jgi:enterochelin esterase-like enzyme
MRMICRLIVALCLLVSATKAQDFQACINRLYALPENQRTPVVDSLMAAVPSFPFVEYDTLAHFIYRGNVTTVTIPGDANNWNPASFPMNRVSGTDFWYLTRAFESDARLDYKFVTNGSNWILDPRNPRQVSGGFGPNSELRMAQYEPAPEIQYDPNIPHGKLRDTTLTSAALGNSRTIRIYTPPGYDSSSAAYPVILFHDGLEYVSLAQANNTIDYLIAHDRIQPIIAVFVPPNAANRHEEYAASKIVQFSAFIVDDVMGWVNNRYRVRTDPASRAVMCASDGGDISLYLGLNYPGVFGNVAAQSSNIISSVSSGFQNGPRLNLKIYCDLGTYDIPELLPLVRNFIPILQSKGYSYLYREYHEGHSWGSWRAHVPDALVEFFPAQSSGVRQKIFRPGGYSLEQNYPNPANPVSTIAFTLPSAQHVVLKIFDITGREVMALFDGPAQAGRREVRLDGGNLSTGIYFYNLRAEGFSETKKMLLIR